MHPSLLAAIGLGLALAACQPTPPRGDAVGSDRPPAAATPAGDASDPTTETRDLPVAAPAATRATVPEAFVGRYASSSAACAEGGDDSALDIAPSRVQFHESSGEVVSAQRVGEELRVVLDMAGEGERWQRGYRFRRDGDGALVDVDGGSRRIRCGAG